jgi:hypothetical protein
MKGSHLPVIGALRIGLIALCAMAGTGAWSQEPLQPLPTGTKLVAEYSRQVSLAMFSGDRSWSEYRAVETVFVREATGELLLTAAPDLSLRLDPVSFLHYRAGFGNPVAQDLKMSAARQPGQVAAGMRWQAELTADFPPASWCKDARWTVVSSIEIEPAELYEIAVAGQPMKVRVLPVVERGTWNRCYTGRRYTRTLYSPELGTILSVEHVGYTPTGQAHASSYRVNVKEIAR